MRGGKRGPDPDDDDEDHEGWQARERRRRRNAWWIALVAIAGPLVAIPLIRAMYPAPPGAIDEAAHYPFWAYVVVSIAPWILVAATFAVVILRRIERTKPWE